ncbi:MAG: GNAT family N-acetyltransferase [Chloroflexi bacterium]|nr:GNAT family N-acetyltransferase [Chloroflexota bacterium]MQC25677.1 GNAT family N-acetyltransferase [Chloroflexota bacterium]
MTDALRRDRAVARAMYQVRESRDKRLLEARLSDDRALSAYALGHLEPELMALAQFWTADGPGGQATVMHARALGSVTVTIGDPAGVEAIMSVHPGLRSAYLSTASPDHIPVLKRTHFVTDTLRMMRMSVNAFTFQDLPGEVRRLRGVDAQRINALYATDGSPSRYSQAAIERAVYYGAFDDGRLLAVAGTHIVSPHQSLAVVGNVLTHPLHRGQGLATRVTAAVTRDLLRAGCSEVVLTVDPHNTPAVVAYTRLGYRQGAAVIEARLQRTDTFGMTPAWRRYLAKRRGRALGGGIELVALNQVR